jgi:hypothetical protein
MTVTSTAEQAESLPEPSILPILGLHRDAIVNLARTLEYHFLTHVFALRIERSCTQSTDQ